MMKKQLLNHTRKQRWLLVLLVLALLPQWTLAQNSIVIAGTPVSASGPVTGSNISGSVSMDFDNNILTLSNATIDGTIDGGIMWNNTGGDDLTIKMSGKNSIVVSSGDAIDAQQSCSLHIKKISTAESATLKHNGKINFSRVIFDYEVFRYFNNVENLTTYDFYTTKDVYDLKVCNNQIQVHDIEGELGYKDNILQENGTPTVTFDGINTLTLDNATLTSNIGWENDSKSLTIALKGKNSITSTLGSCIVIPTALVARQRARKKTAAATISFVKKDVSSSDPCSLTLSCPDGNDVIKDFANSTSPGMGTGLTWIEQEQDANNKIVKAAVATSYGLTVAGVQVNSANASDILKGTTNVGMVSFEPASSTNNNVNTLTLNGASLDFDGIESGLDNLTIHLKGTNYIGTDINAPVDNSISSTVSTAKLTFTSDVDVNDNNRPTGKLYFPFVNNLYDGFSNIVYENGLEFGVVYDSNLGDTPCVGEIGYGLAIGGTEVTSANYSPIKNDAGNSINASYNKDTHTLTIDGASWTETVDWSANANLTVEVKGSNSITTAGACFTSLFYNTITFTRGDATKPCSLQLSAGTTSTVIENFSNSESPTMGTGLTWFEEEKTGSNVTKAFVAEYYNIYFVIDGKEKPKVHSGNASDVFGDGKVTYNLGSNTLTLNGASITGAFEYEGTQDLTVALNGTNSVVNTGGTYALNSQAGGKFNFVKASGATSAELTATCGDGYNPISFYSSSLGDGLYWALTTPASTTSIIITDNTSKVLLAPTIAFDADKDYFATDKIAVTCNDKDNISTDIFYTWGNAVIGTVYMHDDTDPNNPPTLTKYDGTNKIPVESGTLRAWVGYKYGSDNFYVLSEAASQAFTVKTDISKCAVEGLSTTETYTGSKVEPTFTVTDNANNKTLTKNTDYTVAYYKVVNKVPGNTPVDMIEVGEYQIVISGKGDYGGTKCLDFDITKANLSIVTIEAIADQNYTGSEIKPEIKVTLGDNVVAADGNFTIQYSQNTNVTTETVKATVTLTALAASACFTEGTTKTANFNIIPKAVATDDITVTLSAESVLTYDGTEKKPVVASVKVPGVDAPIVLTTADYDADNVVYENNINAGNATATVTLKGNYSGTGVGVFTINKADLAGVAISKIAFGGTEYEYTGSDIEIPYTGEAIHPTVSLVTFNDGTVDVDASEYTVSWGDNNTNVSDAAAASVKITSTGKNFTAGTSTSLNFKIVAAKVTITAPDQSVTYNGSAQAYTSATVDNTKATLAVAYYTKEDDRTKGSNALAGAPTDAGTYYVRVTQTNSNFTADAKNATFTIDQLSLTGAVITLDKDELDYNGTELTVGVTKVMVGTIEVPAASYEVGGNKQTEPGEYTLTVTAKVNEGTFKNNFKGSATATYTVKKNLAVINFLEGLTYMTYYNANTNLFLPDGVTAYIVTGTDGAKVTVTKVSYLKAGVPLLLEKTDGSTTVVDPNDSFDGNKLVYVSSDLTTTSQQYVLYNNEFVKASGTIPAGKVYLEVDITSAARVLTIGEGTTGIDNLQLDNLQIDNWYDLQGRRIDKPTKKGIYILNGKKTAIK